MSKVRQVALDRVERHAGELSDWCSTIWHYEPPIHFRWPEYITTERGEEWWIPAMPDKHQGSSIMSGQ